MLRPAMSDWLDIDDIIRAQPWHTRMIVKWYGLKLRAALWMRRWGS